MANTRERVLGALLHGQEGFVSGEALAEELGISRTAVFKHIAALKANGYEIESQVGKGHRLVGRPDVLSSEEIRCCLSTTVLGNPLQCLDEVASTNDVAKAWAADGCPEGAVVVADAQTGGRGRRGRAWASPPGKGIYVSFVLRPDMPPAELGRLSLLMALATTRAIHEVTGLDARTKWPNDVLVDGRKVAGILVEADTDPEHVHAAIVGVGLNVSHSAADMPTECRGRATSLSQQTGTPVRRIPLLCAVLQHAECVYRDLEAGAGSRLMDDYRAREASLGAPVTIHAGQQVFEGTAVHIKDTGEMVLHDGKGEDRSFIVGDVTLRERPTASGNRGR